MNCLARLQITIVITLLLMSSLAFGYGVTISRVQPDSLPKGATVNDQDGDHHFMQAIEFTVEGVGTVYGAGFTLTIPTGISLADPDGDGDYKDGVSVIVGTGSADIAAATWTVFAAGAQSIKIVPSNGSYDEDEYTLIFPITTTLSASDSVQYSLSFGGETATKYVQFSRKVTSQASYYLDLVTWGTSFDGTAADSTDTKGEYYPRDGSATNMLSVALPDFITDRTDDGTGSGDVTQGSDTDFESITLNNADNDEVTFYVWASKRSDLVRIDGEDAAVIQALNMASGSSVVLTANEDDQISALIDCKVLDEGTWYFYLTSSVTSDWVLGRSGALKVTHRPTFVTDANEKNESFGVDYDNDFLFEPDGTDDVSTLYLDAAGALGRDGNIGSTGAAQNVDTLGIVYNIIDYDDEATIRIYRALTTKTITADSIYTSGTAPNITIDSLAGATEMTSSALTADESNRFFYYDPVRSSTDYDAAGSYYLYAVANDGTWQVLKQMTNGAGTALTLTLKYFPKFRFDDDYYNSSYSSNIYTFDTASEQYFVLNWGNTITGDNEIDGTMKVKLYASDLMYSSAGGSTNPSSVDTTALADDATSDTAHTVLIATLLDTSDEKRDNRYMWDVRNSGLAANTHYYIYAVVTSPIPSGGRDAAIVTMNVGEDMLQGTQRKIWIDHDDYILPKAPPEGEVVQLDRGDSYELRWESFDMDASASNCEVAAFMVPTGTSISSSITWTQTMDRAGTNYYWLIPATNGLPITHSRNSSTFGSNSGRFTFKVSDLDNDMYGGGSYPSGTFDVYYFYSTDGTFGTETPVQADGSLYFSTDADNNSSYNFRLQPTVATISKGDTITLNVYATDPGSPDPMGLNIYLNIPAAYFTIIDQDTTSSWTGTTPFVEVTSTFNGDVTTNLATLTNGVYQCDFETHYSGGQSSASVSNTKVAYLQLIAKQDASADVLEDHIIDFNTTGSRITRMISTQFVDFGQNVPDDAAHVYLAPRGKITGFVNLQGAPGDSGQVVNFFLCGRGGYDCISDSAFLAANNDTDWRDGIQYTLGANGKYTLTQVPTGKYDLICAKDGWLSQRSTNQTVQPHSTTTINFYNADRLLAGDCGGYDHDGLSSTATYPNNQINAADYNVLESFYDKTWRAQNDTGWHSFCDFNQDSVIDVLDLQWPAKNVSVGNGEGLYYPSSKPNGEADFDNNQIEIYLVEQLDDMNVYGVRTSNFEMLSCYDVRIYINEEDWEIVSIENKLKSPEKIFFTKKKGYVYTVVSATLGNNVSPEADQTLFTFTLLPRVELPRKPRLQNATLVNVYSQVNTPVIHVGIRGEVDPTIPTDFSLSQNYPNPFNPTTQIRFALPVAGEVKLIVYNMLGQQVRELVANKMEAGIYNVIWDGMNDNGNAVSSGMYLYRIRVDNKFVRTRKMMLLK